MTTATMFSLTLGTLIGACYVVSAYATFRFAAGRSQRVFLLVALGGVGIRLLAAASVIALVIALTDVHQPLFLGSFFAVFVVGLVLEVTLLHRRQPAVTHDSLDNA